MATLKERDPEEYAALCVFYDAAVEKISDPNFERVQPPPQDKTPFALIDAWGIECFRLGFEMACQLTDNE